MPVSIAPNRVTQLNISLWDQGFAMLSMERCLLFFTDIGLPPEIVKNPRAVTQASRDYLGRRTEPKLRESDCPDSPADHARANIATFFEQIARSYDEWTLNYLAEWFLRYIADDEFSNDALVWREIFRRLCGWTTGTISAVTPSLDRGVVTHMCALIQGLLSPEMLLELKGRVDAARVLPKAEWDEYLDQQLRFAAGKDFSLGAIDVALDLVVKISSDDRTFQSWRKLQNHLSDIERRLIIEWAHRQGVRIPSQLSP